jgi:uncharacterized membrane protein YfcA
MMIGIPPMVAVPSQLCNAIGTNFIGFLNYWRHHDVDFALAWYLFVGGVIGAALEMVVLNFLNTYGASPHMNVTGAYMVILGFLGSLMLYQNVKALISPPKKERAIMMRHWMIYFPWHRIFTRARTEMSVLVPIFVGILTGILTSTLGGGNNLFMLPIVSYLIGRTSPCVSGTALLASFTITIAVTLFHGFSQSPSDWLLVLILLIGSSIGSQIGVKIGYKIPRIYVGLLGSMVILLICAKFSYDFFEHNGEPVTMPTIELSSAVDNHFLASALESAPDWSRWIVKFAYYYPGMYSFSGIFGVILLGFFIERFLRRYIIIRRPKKL